MRHVPHSDVLAARPCAAADALSSARGLSAPCGSSAFPGFRICWSSMPSCGRRASACRHPAGLPRRLGPIAAWSRPCPAAGSARPALLHEIAPAVLLTELGAIGPQSGWRTPRHRRGNGRGPWLDLGPRPCSHRCRSSTARAVPGVCGLGGSPRKWQETAPQPQADKHPGHRA